MTVRRQLRLRRSARLALWLAAGWALWRHLPGLALTVALLVAVDRVDVWLQLRGRRFPSRARRMLDEFHTHPNCLPETDHPGLRRTLLREELDELLEALDAGDRAQIARECADVLYVVYGTGWAHGLDLDAALEEIHRAAMDKMRAGVRRGDGKIVKPPGFVPPDMSAATAGRR